MSCYSPASTRALRALMLLVFVIGGCAHNPEAVQDAGQVNTEDYVYTIAPGDRLNIFVWRNEDISASNVPVMPDGRISTPLVEQVMASGKTLVQLADDIEQVLAKVIANPYVTVTVADFQGSYAQTIRVVGEASVPKSIPFRNDMTLLDVIIEAGGLTEFAAGNRASIVRNLNGKQSHIKVRLEDLVKRGELDANIKVAPGDILIIPESLF